MSKIEPRTLKGFRDFLPEDQIQRQKMIEIIRASYETFGFEPLETPALEYAEILTGKYGEEGDKLMYRFRDNGDRDVALRYDLTIPLARVAAQYENEIKKPFKRYQISPVWRAENTQKGRFREFYQCDADIVGSNSLLADAEILALSANTLLALGLKNEDFVIRVNSREIISAFYDSLKLSSEQKSVAIRMVDKIDKIGEDGVREELSKNNFSDSNIKSVLNFATGKLKEGGETKEAFEKLQKIIEKASTLSPKTKFVTDFSIARGLDYYTGMIFETTLIKAPQFGSVMSGGRYDNLIGMFANKTFPAVGTSIGLDRLIAALEELKLIKTEKTVIRALVVNFEESLEKDYLKLVSDLRNAGINTMLYFDTADLKKQLSYANDRGIPFALLYGQNEAKEGLIIVKNLVTGTQEKVKFDEVINYLSIPFKTSK